MRNENKRYALILIISSLVFTECNTSTDTPLVMSPTIKAIYCNTHHNAYDGGLSHTYATKSFERDVPLKTVSTLLGHSNIAITADIYTHVMPKKKNDAATKLNDLFD